MSSLQVYSKISKPQLGSGRFDRRPNFGKYVTRWWQLTYFSFWHLGEMIPFDEHIFQMSWNHQLGEVGCGDKIFPNNILTMDSWTPNAHDWANTHEAPHDPRDVVFPSHPPNGGPCSFRVFWKKHGGDCQPKCFFCLVKWGNQVNQNGMDFRNCVPSYNLGMFPRPQDGQQNWRFKKRSPIINMWCRRLGGFPGILGRGFVSECPSRKQTYNHLG